MIVGLGRLIHFVLLLLILLVSLTIAVSCEKEDEAPAWARGKWQHEDNSIFKLSSSIEIDRKKIHLTTSSINVVCESGRDGCYFEKPDKSTLIVNYKIYGVGSSFVVKKGREKGTIVVNILGMDTTYDRQK